MFNELLARWMIVHSFLGVAALRHSIGVLHLALVDSTYSLSPVSKMDLRCIVMSVLGISFA